MLVALLGLRVWQTERGPPLAPWHTHVPPELSAGQIDQTDWAGWMAAEDRAFQDVLTSVVAATPEDDPPALNRYAANSPVNPARFARDWNRSAILMPNGPPAGAAVFLHGLTDAPYSLRAIAEAYRDRGFVAVLVRLPGHGTVPAGLTAEGWPDWLAATRLAVRTARSRVPAGLPLHLVGYSNGGALAVKYALDALADPTLAAPDRLVLLSPMIGVTGFARFAGFAGWPAFLPAFAKAAWLGLVPEFNPFKYNSFPVHAARESWRLTAQVRQGLEAAARTGTLARLPPILTFQSALDATVSTRAVVTDLHARLPAGRGALVLFDVNHATSLRPVLTAAARGAVEALLPPAPRPFTVTIVTNAAPGSLAAEARTTPAGSTATTARPLRAPWPADVFSLSHVAVPFAPADGLYGFAPDPADDFGIQLGAIAGRGERGGLAVDLDTMLRMTANPFYAAMLARIVSDLPPFREGPGAKAQALE